MNIHIQNWSMWLINLHGKQNGGDDCEQTNSREIFLANLMNINEFEGNAPRRVRTVYSGMKLKSAANSSVVAGFLRA